MLGRYAVRLYTSALAHLVLDLSGVTIKGRQPAAAGKQSEGRTGQRGEAPAQGRRSRLAERFLSRLSR